MKFRLCLHELLVDVLQNFARTERERVMNRLINRVVGVAACAVDMIDGVTGGASDSGL